MTPANAEPTTAPPSLTYSVKLQDKKVVTSLRGGTFELSKATTSDVVNVKDGEGRILLTLPLEFHLGATDIPVEPEIQNDGTVLALTPDRPADLSLAQPITVKPVASQAENDRALANFSQQFGLATTIGTFVGTALGATVGCVATLVAGCVAGFLTGATVGGILGTIALGGPTLLISGFDLLNTMEAKDGTTRWADKTTPAPTPQAAAQPGS
ncbi:hypothetical protein GPX89_02695 [Nocardia sp. ET3-3]|uniref:DUF8020 domain-containing protein n=1 Tax=Nocardia terrae TaxID=2675851 RepID=A0A7K1UP84_9NOCA|nr:hypothetical protein [Nocardia terrae]